MADLEQEFICKLCAANSADQRKVQQSSVAAPMFLGYDAEAGYVWRYFEKYRKFPSLTTLHKHFPAFPPIPVQEPMRYYIDQMIERDRFKVVQTIMSEANKHLKAHSLSGVQEALQTLAKAQDALRGGYSDDQEWKDWDALANYLSRTSNTDMYTTPYHQLNRMVIGMRHKNLVTLTARPGMCKTWIMIVFALHFRSQGARVLFISKEMTKDEIYERMDALEFDLPWIDFVEGKIPLKTIKRHQRQRKLKLKTGPSFIVSDSEDMSTNSLDSVDSKIVEYNPDIVMIDGAYLMDESSGRTFTEKSTTLSRGTKKMAKHRNVLLMQTLQMNRQAEEEIGNLGTIAWADAYGQDSDVVMFIKGKREEPTRVLELLKARTAGSGGIGELYIKTEFAPKLDFSEMTAATTNTVSVSTVEG